MDLSGLREEYGQDEFRRCDLHPDPIEQFRHWFSQAQEAKFLEPNAMVLATASAEGYPSTRTVLLKYFDASGFVFFTNYESIKGKQLKENPRASLLFQWLTLQRQIIICGTVEKITEQETQNYFAKRPRDSQIGAWVSPQSNVIASRATLESEWEKIKENFADKPIPTPPFWGGYRIKPQSIEFWQGGKKRLHDRFHYRHSKEGWIIERLAP